MASEPTVNRAAAISPLSQGERALWFLQQLHPDSAAYNIVRAATLRGGLDVDAFRGAWQRLMDRHPILRSTFSATTGEPVRVIHEHMPVAFQVVDATDWAETAVSEYFSRELSLPFDLTRGPLMRVKLLTRPRQEHVGIAVWHHSVADLWSLGIMLYEMDALYGGGLRSAVAALRRPKASYSDFVQEQAEMLASPEGERLWAFWRQQLEGAPQVLDLPADHPRPPVQSWQGSTVVRRLSAPLAKRLRDLATEMGTTLPALSMAAFSALVHRYTSQDEFLIGTPRAGRSRKYFQTVGYFVNPIVMRVDASGNPPFAEFVRRISKTWLDAREHQAYPFIRIVEQLLLRRDLSRSPLYQVGFAWQKGTALGPKGLTSFALHESGGEMNIGGVVWEFRDLERQVVPIDLNWLMVEDGAEVAICAEYSTALFDRTTIQRMIDHFCTLLEEAVDDPEARLWSLPLMPSVERDRIVLDWSGYTPKQIFAPVVHESFEAKAAEWGDKPALVLGDGRLTYDELNRRSNQLARHLRMLGVGPNVPVALCVNRGLDMVVGLLAILKAGGVYLPLDPAYPADRNAFILGDARPRVVLTQSEHVASLSTNEAKVVCLDRDRPTIAMHEDGNPGFEADGASAAYIIYTSGSTGRPKGIAVSHAAIADHCREMAAHFGIRPEDRVLQFASLCFDASLEQILTTLLSGATLFPRGGELWEPADFHHWLAAHDITVVNVPPAYWHQWVRAYYGSQDWAPVNKLRLVIVGGDVMRIESLRLWCETPLHSTRLLNAYGPTETTITATTYEVCSEQDAHRARIPIGRPLPGRRTYVLDSYGNPVPAGVPGELHLGGAGLALGYLGKTELTMEKFVPDPFSPDSGARLYRTGDRARYLPDGNLEHLGRIDLQLKVRGFRIEPEEVESVLAGYSGVAKAAVTTIADHQGDSTLAAFLVPAEGADLAVDQLRDFLAARLPDYMVPVIYVPVDDLPLGPGGKVDRRGLSELGGTRLTAERPYVAPRDPIEAEIVRMWSEVLSVERVGVNDDFFELGGHSLLATQVVSRIREAFGVEIPLQQLFEAPTVARLSLLVTQSLVAQEDEGVLSDLLEELGSLSDVEVERLLADEIQNTP